MNLSLFLALGLLFLTDSYATPRIETNIRQGGVSSTLTPTPSAVPSPVSVATPSVVTSPIASPVVLPAFDIPPEGYTLLAASVPGGAGAFLGTVGLETTEFRNMCSQCCRRTVNTHKNTIALLQGCHTCSVGNVKPVRNGNCSQGAPLGYARTPSPCFYHRCSRMLAAARPNCMCLK